MVSSENTTLKSGGGNTLKFSLSSLLIKIVNILELLSFRSYDPSSSSDADIVKALENKASVTAVVDGEESRALTVGGAPVKCDAMGPVVVATDGSLSRITNWAEMSEQEQANTLRLVGKRNQSRLAALKAKESEANP